MTSATSIAIGQAKDVVGVGRYILSFLLAGIIGVGVQHALREEGWLATWINLGIMIVMVFVFAAIG